MQKQNSIHINDIIEDVEQVAKTHGWIKPENIVGYDKEQIKNVGPGPAKYNVKLNVYKKQYPAYSMKFRHNLHKSSLGPGPKYSYNINLIKTKPPVYSFGIRYNQCVGVGFTEDD